MNKEFGMLYIVATPIGNLEDITYRAVKTLKNVDFILCEDTRHSIKLLNHYDIRKPLVSYHKFNEHSSCEYIITRLLNGENAALISDAGLPLISDPGSILVKALIQNNIEFTVLPGANAALTALMLSGFSSEHFTFYGFLPKKEGKREQVLSSLEGVLRPIIFYVAPHELKNVLLSFEKCFPNDMISVSKELTKVHEKTQRKTASEFLRTLEEPVKGEFVLVLGEKEKEDIPVCFGDLSDEDVNREFSALKEKGLDRKSAMKEIARTYNVSKRDVYERLMIRE